MASDVAPDESNVVTDVSPVTSNVESSVTASSTFNVPFTVVIIPDEAISTTPPPVASEVAPVESNVVTDVSPVTSNVESRVTASSTFNVPFTVVIRPVEAIFTTPPPVAKEVAPDESNVVTEVSPVISKVPSRVTASSTFNVPFTVVIRPVEAIFTTPPPVAKEVAPDESNVVTEASPVTSKVPPIFVFSAIPTPPPTIKAPVVVVVDVVLSLIFTTPPNLEVPAPTCKAKASVIEALFPTPPAIGALAMNKDAAD